MRSFHARLGRSFQGLWVLHPGVLRFYARGGIESR